jgi:hypothetical protein
MRKTFRFVTHAFPALAVVSALVPAAHAGCGDTSKLQAPFVFAQPGMDGQALLQRAAEASRAAATSAAANDAQFNTATIVGMWSVQFVSQGNTAHTPPILDGALIDFGYAQWHSDGTELMNSGGHAPATQNFCMGVCVRSGFFTYELNHFALSYNATTGALAAKVDIREQVTLYPSGNEFTGTFTIDVYDPKSGQKLDHLAGNISALRVTVDQTAP